MNHQVRMDVIGNNISNVNTVGFRNRRVTFQESFNQLMKGASRSESKAGGTNPMQVGLGVSVGSIDTVTGQGNLQNTGRIFDLAIEGNAFFGVSDGQGTFYTRNGAFQLDSQGYIILPTNGMVLQGRMADSYGNFPPGTAIGNLQIPMNQQAPARETTEVSLGRNLNSEADAKGNVVHTQQFLRAADGARPSSFNGPNDPGKGATPLAALHNSNGQSLGMKANDVITISWYDQASVVPGTPPTQELRVTVAQPTDPLTANTIWNIEDLRQAIETAINVNGATAAERHEVLLNSDGSFQINHNGAASNQHIFNLQVSTSNPEGRSYVNNAFHFGSHIGPEIGNYGIDGVNLTANSTRLLRPAEQFDLMSTLFDRNGQPLYPGLDVGDPIDVFGSVGRNSIEADKSDPLKFYPPNYYHNATGEWWYLPAAIMPAPGTQLGSDPADLPGASDPLNDVGARRATLLDDLIAKIRNDFKLPVEYIDRDGTHLQSVSMNPAGTDDGIPPGSLVIRGAKGVDFSINNLSIRAVNSNADQTAPTFFNAATGITERRKAEDIGIVETVIAVYDESGAEHILTMTFVHTGRAGEWEWRASFAGNQEIVPGSGTGRVTFGQDGTVSSWIFDNGGSQLLVDPRNGSNTMRINLNVGGPGDFRGITQFASASTINSTGQDGYPTGNLIEVSIDEFGVIEGAFSNGTARKIAQIMLIDFANPGGLLNLSDSIYTTSANSGDPIYGLPLTQSSSKLKPGALEMSNVDLAAEFTNMITTQRGYQANSRIITVSDSMLEELVNLKR
jgi:flagellar hook protein FlgE